MFESAAEQVDAGTPAGRRDRAATCAASRFTTVNTINAPTRSSRPTGCAPARAAHVGEGAHAPSAWNCSIAARTVSGRRSAGTIETTEDFGEVLGLRRRLGPRRLLRPAAKTLR